MWVCWRRNGHELTSSSSLHHTRTVKLVLVQCGWHTGKCCKVLLQDLNEFNQTRDADHRFSNIFWFLVPISRGEWQKPVLPYLRTPIKAVRISWKTKCPWKNFKWSGNHSSWSLVSNGCMFLYRRTMLSDNLSITSALQLSMSGLCNSKLCDTLGGHAKSSLVLSECFCSVVLFRVTMIRCDCTIANSQKAYLESAGFFFSCHFKLKCIRTSVPRTILH